MFDNREGPPPSWNGGPVYLPAPAADTHTLQVPRP